VEVNEEGEVVWEMRGMAYVHEINEMPNGHLMIADTGYDRVFEINYPDKDVVWEWKPEDIDWEDVNSAWDSDHYFNNPTTYDWTHLNDVDFKNYSTWTGMLVSIRNFDLVVEVNFTSARNYSEARADDIVWYYGDYQDHDLLFHQHNPEYIDNGNIMIADSENQRIIEVNYITKDVVWKYDEGLVWSRDCDELEDDRLLITDVDRVFEINKVTKEVLWEYEGELMTAYEADRLDNGNTLIGTGIGGIAIEVNSNGDIVWQYGVSYPKFAAYMNGIILLLFEVLGLVILIRGDGSNRRSLLAILSILGIILTVGVMIAYHEIVGGIFRLIKTTNPTL
jgi:hypothetical protein